MLARRCEQLRAVDVSDEALERARRRNASNPGVSFEAVDLSREFPAGRYDVVTFCELGFYFSRGDLRRIREAIVASLESRGDLVLVHWSPPVRGHALTTDEVHSAFLATHELVHRTGETAETYRLDAFTRR